jgi:hypothetical protein
MSNSDLTRKLAQEAQTVRRSAQRLSTIAADVPNHSRSLERASRALIAASDYIAVLQAHIEAQELPAHRAQRRTA